MEDFVAALENYVRTMNDKAMFILQKETEPCRFKVFKRFRYILWYIDKSKDKKFPIYIIQNTSRITSPEEEAAVIKELNLKFMTDIFKFIRKEEFKLILDGNYHGNELVSNIDN